MLPSCAIYRCAIYRCATWEGPSEVSRSRREVPALANSTNAAIKIAVLIPTSQLIHKKGSEKLKAKLGAAVGRDISQLR